MRTLWPRIRALFLRRTLDARLDEEVVVPRVIAFRDAAIGGRLRTTFPVLMVMVGFVLVIACANVANLLLAPAAYRAQSNRRATSFAAACRTGFGSTWIGACSCSWRWCVWVLESFSAWFPRSTPRGPVSLADSCKRVLATPATRGGAPGSWSHSWL